MKREKPAMVPEEELAAQRGAMAAVRELPRRPRSYFLITYGCQMNVRDSETLAGMLAGMGMEEAASREEADLILFNTCCVRDNAERRALGNMLWLKELKALRPSLVLCVSGCMIQQPKMARTILRQYPFFDVALGTHNLYRFPSLLLAALRERRQVFEAREEAGSLAEGLPVRRQNPYAAFLTVMYGCDNFCAYCVVPYVRGRERSRDADAIVREAEALLREGVKEITLLGQNVNSYGNDLGAPGSFPLLLRRLDSLGVPRIRFMTSHPKDLSDGLIQAMADCGGVAPHLHLPVQAGSDGVLAAMNRGYTARKYLGRVAALRAAVPDIGLTSDLIVGFPGETEADFQQTLALVEAARYDAAYTFVFSPREGTAAAALPGRVSAEEAKDRIARLIQCQERITAEILSSLVGTEQRVLAEERSRRDGSQLAGKCGRNLTVNFAAGQERIGAFARVRIIRAGRNTLGGALADEETQRRNGNGLVADDAPVPVAEGTA